MNKDLKIVFSRHAKRRLKLYKIDDRDIVEKIQFEFNNRDKSVKSKIQFSVITNAKYSKIKLPIKIIATIDKFDVLVITAYPIKKGKNDITSVIEK